MVQPVEVLISDSEESSRSESSLFVVEWIQKKCINDRGVTYFIKWKGYPESENTWEPPENLECEALLDDFEQRCQRDRSLIIDLRKKLKLKNEDDVSTTTNRSKAQDAQKKREPVTQKSKQLACKTKRSRKTNQNVAKGQKTGFDKGYCAQKILGATNSSGKLKFMVQWKDCNKAELIDAELANEKCPQVVIRFLRERISWIDK